MSVVKEIVIVGRPNVGKSRLFNRLLGRRVSIVHDRPGVTRDAVSEMLSENLMLTDTGGMFASPDPSEIGISAAAHRRAGEALEGADMVVFVVDSQAGLTPLDEEIAGVLRKSGKPVVLAVNKVDVPEHSSRADEFFGLGFADIAEVSAEHGQGIDVLVSFFERDFGKILPPGMEGGDRIKVCVVGRPNVGKSSIVNRLLGGERQIVSEVAGTTRDAVKFNIDIPRENAEPMKFVLFDTAGLKAKNKIGTSLDFLSNVRTRKVVEGCDVAFMVLDSTSGVTDLDKRLAGEIIEAGASAIVVVNKWDKARGAFESGTVGNYKNLREFGKAFDASVRKILNFVGDSRIYFVSALENRGIEALWNAAYGVNKRAHSAVSTAKLNKIMRALMEETPPKYVSGRRFKAYYAVKVSSRPYTVRLYCNNASILSASYRKYLVNGLRERLGLGGVAVSLDLVGKPPRKADGKTASEE